MCHAVIVVLPFRLCSFNPRPRRDRRGFGLIHVLLTPVGVGSRPTLYASSVKPGRVDIPSKSTPNHRDSTGFSPTSPHPWNKTSRLSLLGSKEKGGAGESGGGADADREELGDGEGPERAISLLH